MCEFLERERCSKFLAIKRGKCCWILQFSMWDQVLVRMVTSLFRVLVHEKRNIWAHQFLVFSMGLDFRLVVDSIKKNKKTKFKIFEN